MKKICEKIQTIFECLSIKWSLYGPASSYSCYPRAMHNLSVYDVACRSIPLPVAVKIGISAGMQQIGPVMVLKTLLGLRKQGIFAGGARQLIFLALR